MNREALLAEVEALTHAARMRRMIELGRASLSDPAAKELVETLAASDDAYARTLAAATVFGSRDGALVLRLLEDPSRTVRRRASSVVPLFCDDEQALKALELTETSRGRTRLAAALRERRRFAPVDAFFARLDLSNDRALVEALPFASAETIEHGAAHLEAGSAVAWRRIATLHPAFFARYTMNALGSNASTTLARNPRLRWRLTAVAGAFAERDPAAALTLLRALLSGEEDPGSPLVRALVPFVLRKHPRETFDLLRARHERGAPTRPPGAFGILRLDKVARHLGKERLAYIVEHAWATLTDGAPAKRWFLKLSKEDRRALVDTWISRGRGGWGAFLLRRIEASGPRAGDREKAYERWAAEARNLDGTIPVAVLAVLPSDLRLREARRHLSLAFLSTKPEARIVYASLLPFEEAKTVLAPFLGHPEGDERAKAIRPLVATVLHEPSSIEDALATVRARKFEQDPVRFAMIDALATLPARRFTPEHLDDVTAIVGDALDAADLSHATVSAVERLVIRLFRVDATWGAKTLTTILQKRGSINGGGVGLVDALVQSDVDRLAPGLVDLASTWATQERASALLWLATSLGIRLPRAPAILDALERMARELPFVGVAILALALLRRHAPKRFAALAAEMLAVDPSYIIVDSIATFVSVHRQDLLEPFLEGRPMTGRFATGSTSWAIRFARGHGRWTSRQHRLHAEAWTRLLGDEARDVPTLLAAIGSLAELAFAPRDALLPYASDPRAPVREKAIRALPWLDGGQGIPVLFACLDDARARFAIYALRKAFSEMKRDRVLDHLRRAPTTKVTVAKEVLRLFGELGGPEAYDELLSFDRRPDLHRDVRIALLRALWDHLERDETWPIFERAAAHEDWVVASKLADIPLGRLSPQSAERVVSLLVQVLHRKEPEARLDLLRRAAHLPVPDTGRALFRALLERLGAKQPDEARAAAVAILARMLASEGELVIARLRELATRRQLMVELVPAFAPHVYSPQHVRDLAVSIVTLLARDPLATAHYVRFAGRVMGWKELYAIFDDLAKRDFLHSDAMMAAYEAIASCVHPMLLESKLAIHANARMRRLGVEALRHASHPRDGWTKERRDKLEAYRQDRAPLVAAAAAYIFPPD